MSDDLSIGDVAVATGLSVHALRYFEEEGLFLRPIPRTATGRRRYSAEDVEWLHLCNRFRASGMPIASILRFADLVREGPGNEAARLEMLRDHERHVRAKIAQLEGDLAVISGKVQTYEQHLAAGRAAELWNPTVRSSG
ncbi:MerR family transcriptional regulator [Jiangella gansuensis]|uniref:MerR family transcriptional regulator n=1 Tax=Jiangella gansuensis TaxID=281473 RepID=UPI00047AF2CB|nr:MerR family transcriptional regulator [Jiangella gansuensis]